MKSIKTRLVVNFMLIIIITVVTLETLLIYAVRANYYKNLEDSLYNQVKVSSDLYYKYFSDNTLEDNIINNVDTFWKQTSAEVEIADTSGQVLMDSIGKIPPSDSVPQDIEEALDGQKGIWIGQVDYDSQSVMAVSYPLKSGDKTVGVLRFITSLRKVNDDINQIAYLFILIGLVVVAISGILSIFFSNTIIVPLKDLTRVAEKMASGNLKVQSEKKNDDEIGRLSETLNYMAREIVKKDELKNEFISSVSHELRTPLTSIKGWAVTLQNEKFQTKEMLKDGLDIIEKESDRLTSMVEELLDFSKLVSNKITLKKEVVDITGIMEHIKRQLAPRAARDNISFKVSYEEGIPAVLLDENRLKQLFINILDNAFNFTPRDGEITFTARREESNLLFNIRDTGCGISPEELPKVKEKFYKGKSSKSRNGIGLSICDEIVRMTGGTLEIESEVNKGTEVSIILPLLECD